MQLPQPRCQPRVGPRTTHTSHHPHLAPPTPRTTYTSYHLQPPRLASATCNCNTDLQHPPPWQRYHDHHHVRANAPSTPTLQQRLPAVHAASHTRSRFASTTCHQNFAIRSTATCCDATKAHVRSGLSTYSQQQPKPSAKSHAQYVPSL